MWKHSVFRRTACLVHTARAFSSPVLENDTGGGAVLDLWQEVSWQTIEASCIDQTFSCIFVLTPTSQTLPPRAFIQRSVDNRCRWAKVVNSKTIALVGGVGNRRRALRVRPQLVESFHTILTLSNPNTLDFSPSRLLFRIPTPAHLVRRVTTTTCMTTF